jgi:excisionase family DNA binding protein
MTMRLVNPCPPLPLVESLVSLMNRYAKANYYREANWLESLLPTPTRENLNLLQRADHFARLAELTGWTVGALQGLTLHRFAPCYTLPSEQPWQGDTSSLDTMPQWDNSGLALYVHGQLTSKLCPLCWREHRAILLPWSLRHVTTCPVHQVLLVDHCSRCGQLLRANWRRNSCRNCKQRLTNLPVISFAGHAASEAVTRLIWSALGCYDEPYLPPSLNLPSGHLLQSVCAPAVLQFLWHFGQLLVRRDPQSPLFDPALLLPGTSWIKPPAILRQASVAEVHGVLTALWQLLDGWSQTWEMTLERIVEIEGPFATDEPERLPHLLTTQFGAPEFAWMYRGWEDFMWKHRGRTAKLYPWFRHWRHTQQQQEVRLAHPLLSQREAARRLHVGERALKRFLELERLRTPPPPPLPDSAEALRHWRLIEAESVEEMQHALESELTLEQAATACGITEEAVVALVKAGLLPAIRGPALDHTPVWAFTEQGIQEALTRLIGHLPVCSAEAAQNDDLLTLGQALRIVSGAGIRLPTLLQAVQKGQVAGIRLTNEVTLSLLRFERSKLLAYLEEQRPPEREDTLSIQEVRHVLHCSATTLRRWRANRLLIPCQESMIGNKRSWWYRRQDVMAFAERYITAPEAAALLGWTDLTVQRWTRAGMLPAITGPGIDGGHAYRFDKAALQQWRSERMTAPEVEQLLGISKATLHRWVQEGKLKPLVEGKGRHRWFAQTELAPYTANLGE